MRVLVTSDKHCPAVHPRYLHFCKDLRDKYKCDTIIDIGDITDMESMAGLSGARTVQDINPPEGVCDNGSSVENPDGRSMETVRFSNIP